MAGTGRRSSLLKFSAVLPLLLAGCTSGSPAAPAPGAPAPGSPASATVAAADAECPDLSTSTGGHQVRFGPGGGKNLGGVVAGEGTTGIVLSHESDGSVCDWDLGLGDLVTAGYRVIAFNYPGFGSSETSTADTSPEQDIAAAAAVLRAEGSTRIILMGGSMGAAYSVAAAPVLKPPPVAVIALSSPLGYGAADALGAAPKLKMPVLFAAEQDDNPFGDNAKELYQAARKSSPDARLTVTPGSNHGYRLYIFGGDSQVRDAVDAFLKKYGS